MFKVYSQHDWTHQWQPGRGGRWCSWDTTKKFIEKPSDKEIEAAAKECEFFLENFPVWFPKHSITHKMFILGMILPIFIRRERQMLYHFLSAEERGESIHRLLNEFERQFSSVAFKPLKYFLMKKAYMNRVNLDWNK